MPINSSQHFVNFPAAVLGLTFNFCILQQIVTALLAYWRASPFQAIPSLSLNGATLYPSKMGPSVHRPSSTERRLKVMRCTYQSGDSGVFFFFLVIFSNKLCQFLFLATFWKNDLNVNCK